MSLKPLIKGQTIQVDNHHRGTGVPISWDDTTYDLHIHKRKNNNKRIEADIRIPINSDRPLDINIKKQKNSTTENQLRREIQKALADRSQRQPFIDSLISILSDYPSKFSSRDRAESAVRRLANHFNLSNEIAKEIITYTHEKIESYTAIFEDSESLNFSITLDRKFIKIGEVKI